MNTDEHVKDFYEMMIENNLIPMITFPSIDRKIFCNMLTQRSFYA